MSYHLLNKDAVYARIQESGNLPTLPEILVKLLEACEDQTTPLPDIASLISKDPVLSFKVLQLVNSAYYGLRQIFTGVEQAVIYLGADSIRNVAITTSIQQVFEHKRFEQVKQFSLGRFWWHSLMCATLAKRIAIKTRFGNYDEAYLSGLLHDMGRLVLVSTFPKEHECILLETEDVRNMVWAETQLIGIGHDEVGAWVVEKWKLNSLMTEAIKYHHGSLEQIKESFPLVKIVFLSNLLCEENPGEIGGKDAAKLLLNLTEADVEEIVDGATEEVTDIAESLGIKACPPVSDEALQTENEQSIKEREAASVEEEERDTAVTACSGNVRACPEIITAQSELTSRIKSITLLSSFLENLIKAGEVESVIEAFEQCMAVLFDIEKVIFFLPDKNGVVLKGTTSAANILQYMSRGLILPVQRSTSRIIKTYLDVETSNLTATDADANIIDKQLLSALKSATVLLIPIVAEAKSIGIILLALPDSLPALSKSDRKVLQVLVRQVGLCLHLEQVKAKQAEEIEAQRRAAISMTAKKFAHEINNPLGILGNYLTSLRLKINQEESLGEEFKIIDEELNRISAMVNQLNFFSQSAYGSTDLVDVNEVLTNIVKIFKSSLPAVPQITVSLVLDPVLPQIQTSQDSLKQIMLNLLKNASEAMETGGRIEVRTRKVAQDGNGKEKEEVEIVVRDNGPGVPDSVKENLFKPFHSTKEQGGHVGLGLSIVHRAVKDLGGSISCKSLQAKGTSFSIHLPAGRALNSKNKKAYATKAQNSFG